MTTNRVHRCGYWLGAALLLFGAATTPAIAQDIFTARAQANINLVENPPEDIIFGPGSASSNVSTTGANASAFASSGGTATTTAFSNIQAASFPSASSASFRIADARLSRALPVAVPLSVNFGTTGNVTLNTRAGQLASFANGVISFQGGANPPVFDEDGRLSVSEQAGVLTILLDDGGFDVEVDVDFSLLVSLPTGVSVPLLPEDINFLNLNANFASLAVDVENGLSVDVGGFSTAVSQNITTLGLPRLNLPAGLQAAVSIGTIISASGSAAFGTVLEPGGSIGFVMGRAASLGAANVNASSDTSSSISATGVSLDATGLDPAIDLSDLFLVNDDGVEMPVTIVNDPNGENGDDVPLAVPLLGVPGLCALLLVILVIARKHSENINENKT